MKRTISILLLACICALCACTKQAAQAPSPVEKGIRFLESQEAQDPGEVAEVLAEIRQKELDAAREQKIESLLSGEVNVWSQFRDFVILGDSRAVGYWVFDFLDKSRVLADGGETIANVPDRLEGIKALNPSYIFLCYGLNDVSIGYWDTKEEYVEAFAETIALLQKEVPNAKLIVSSILPARDPAFDLDSSWRQIPEYSALVGQWCAEHSIAFADNDAISETYSYYWQNDGIHVMPEFYPYWAANLIIASWEDTDE
ncbi:MAG: GDSL-type esterase/lipase family protein [Clostridia bacterium]|nr:GDSL-type esterase/lipase family protein [Clostridia bacterium]